MLVLLVSFLLLTQGAIVREFHQVIKNILCGLMTVLVCWTSPLSAEDNPPARIAWYGDLQEGLKEAKRSSRLILLVSGAPHCLGVPGVW